MATFSKPTTVPNWATTSLNVSVPSAGKRNDGWLSTEVPASDIENWNKRTQGEWLEWIDERFADGATADELVIRSPATTDEMLKLSNAIAKWSSAAGIEWESVAGIFTAGRSVTNGINLKGIGNVKDIEFDGTLNRMSYDVSTNIWSLFNNSATASLTVSETVITAKKALTLDVDLSATVSGTGRYKHGEVGLNIGAQNVVAADTAGAYNPATAEYDVAFSGQNFDIPIVLDVGKRIKAGTLFFGSSTADTKRFSLMRKIRNGSPAEIDFDTSVVNGDGNIALSGITETITFETVYFWRFNSGDASDQIHQVEMIYDHP